MNARVLELRIHGVNNTPPHAMLGLPDYATVRVRGDKLGSFWQPNASYVAQLPDDNPARVPDGVRREAYSWGGIARTTPGASGTGVPSMVVNVLGRIGWALLLPLGLANVGYWSRRLPDESARREAEESAHTRARIDIRSRWGRGAASTRLFALGLTILLVLTVCEVAIDIVAVQCGTNGSCAKLPDLPVAPGDPRIRVVWASLVPVLVLIGLHLLTWVSRSRYEQHTGDLDDPSRPKVVLSAPRMWAGSPRIGRLTRLHLATGFAVVALTTSAAVWHENRVFAVPAIFAIAIVVVAAWRVCYTAPDSPDVPTTAPEGRWSWGLFVAGAILLGVQEVLLGVVEVEFTGPLWTTTWLQPGVIALFLCIVLSALGWRNVGDGGAVSVKGVARFVSPIALVVGLCISYWYPLIGLIAALVGTVGLVTTAWLPNDNTGRRREAWFGAGPGILLGLSLTASVALSSIVVLTFRGWIDDDDVPDAGRVTVPPVYEKFSGAFATAVVLMLVIVVVLLVLIWTVRFLRPTQLPRDRADGEGDGKKIVRWRHAIALAHRAEAIVGVLSVLGIGALWVTVFLSFHTPSWAERNPSTWVMQKSDWITGLIGVAVIGAFVGGGMLANKRPFGLLWDLICFLPRTAHPFAPPCYAERAVPELTDCTRKWLRADTDREVVLSAHSLGGVLAVATIFALPDEDVERVKLLTYGVQLRTYFGRIFPELLGPLVLGTPGADAASPLARDPWVRRGKNRNDTSASPEDYSLSKLLDKRWFNLWRRTDYLGFPVYGWQENPIDRRANETNGSGKVQTHSDYPLCASYKEQFETLVPPSPTDSPRTPRS